MAELQHNVEEEILNQEKKRCDALLKNDIAYLENLFSDDLVYTHASGRTDGKASYLEPRRSGSVEYHGFKHQDQKVRVYGNVAVLTGRIVTDVSVNKARKVVDHLFTSVWVRDVNRSTWLFTTYASSAVP